MKSKPYPEKVGSSRVKYRASEVPELFKLLTKIFKNRNTKDSGKKRSATMFEEADNIHNKNPKRKSTKM
jgi:hypothetical protein